MENNSATATAVLTETGGAVAAYKAEQETQNTIARAHPRDPRNALNEALTELEIVPEYACKAFYSIPFKDRSSGEERIVKVEGPSIKASQCLVRVWGNNASGWRIKDQTTERVEVEGVYIDQETNTRTVRAKTASRFYVSRDGKKIQLREDKMTLAIAAAGSKAVRDACLAGMPNWLVDSYYQKARVIAAKTIGGKALTAKPRTYQEKIDWVAAALLKKGVTADQFKAYLAKFDQAQSEDERIADIVGVFNAINDGQASIKDMFGGDADGKTYAMPKMTGQAPADARFKIKSVARTDFNGEEVFVIKEDKEGGAKYFTADAGFVKAAKEAKGEVVVTWEERSSGDAKGRWLLGLTAAA